MTEFIGMIGEGLQAVIYGVATALLYPVLAFEVIALVVVVYEAGRFTIETIRRARTRRRIDIDAVTTATAEATDASSLTAALGGLGDGPITAQARRSLDGASDLSRSRLLKALADAEFRATKRLEHTRILIRVGPILGLMGTLIPISPALVGLAQGDVQALSNNLVIAFSTTVVGLLIGGLAYIITTFRDRFYQQDIVNLEYVLDRLEV